MRIVAFTPIRLNSKRLPQKSILILHGKPLVNYAIDVVDKFNFENFIYCSDEDIMKHVDSTHVKFLKRDPKLDDDDVLGKEIYDEFIKQIDADVYILYHVTSPLLTFGYYVLGLDAILNRNFDSAFSVKKTKTFTWMNNDPLNFDLNNIPKTQSITPLYLCTSGFFMFTKEVWIKLHRRIGNKSFMVEVDDIAAIDIDEKSSFKLCEIILKEREIKN